MNIKMKTSELIYLIKILKNNALKARDKLQENKTGDAIEDYYTDKQICMLVGQVDGYDDIIELLEGEAADE